MSSGGAILGVAGAVVGSFFGNPLLGLAIGLGAGAILFPPKMPDGPRLDEKELHISTYGKTIPRGWGRTRRRGNYVWATPYVTTAHESDGKGTPSQTTYTYSGSCAISFGSPGKVRRMWAFGKLIYDASVENTGATKDFTADGFVIYEGSETQQPDPTIVAYEGSSPAYRGQVLVVFTNLQLDKFSNGYPFDIEAEVVSGTAVLPAPVAIGSGSDGGVVDPVTGYYWTVTEDTPTSDSSTVYVNDPVTGVVLSTIVIPLESSESLAYNPDTRTFWVANSAPALLDEDYCILSADGMVLIETVEWSSAAGRWPGAICYNSTAKKMYIGSVNGVAQSVHVFSYLGGQAEQSIPGINAWVLQMVDMPEVAQVAILFHNATLAIVDAVTHSIVALHSAPTYGTYTQTLAWDPVRHLLTWAKSGVGDYVYVVDVDAQSVQQTFLPTAIGGIDYIIYHKQLDRLVARGGSSLYVLSAESLALEGTFAQSVSFTAIAEAADTRDYVLAVSISNVAYRLSISNRIQTSNTSPATIISEISKDVGLSASDYDVSDISYIPCIGFEQRRQAAARSVIEPLLMAYQIEVVESGGKIKYRRRNTKSVRTIQDDDLSVHYVGQAVPADVQVKREDETRLPRKVVVNYMNANADYQVSSQSAERQATTSVHEETWDIPVVLSDADGKAIAELALPALWAARTKVSWTTTAKHADLEPTDVVTVRGLKVLIAESSRSGNLIRWRGALCTGDSIASGAPASNAPVVSQTIPWRSKTFAEFMDIPILRDQDNDAGFYVAACGYPGRSWSGCSIFKSSDGGGTWDEVATLAKAATIGVATTVLGSFIRNVFDEFNAVTVRLLNGTLTSIGKLAVLNGGNVALLGDEIIQFRTAALNGDGTYTLSGLLRGRKGSFTSGHAIGDRFVLLDASSVRRVDMATSEIGAARLYKAVSVGDTLAEAGTVSFVNNAIGLECLSPVHLGGGRNAAGDVSIKCVRRTRIGGEWRNYVDALLGEVTESYEVEVWNSSYTTLKRTITGLLSPSATYSASDQIADFGSVQITVYVRVYQLSATVGRGFALQGAI